MSGLKRTGMEKFYTNPDISSKYIGIFKKVVKPKKKDIVVEPSAGNGSFSNLLRKGNYNVFSYDIEPEEDYILKQDFLVLDTTEFKEKKSPIHVIGNPPFGRQSGLAKRFIRKCCEFADTISFVLPRSFKKDSFKKVFSLSFHLVHEEDVPKNSFLLENKEYDVPCVFQIWVKKDEEREEEKKLEPTYYAFVKKEENPDFSIKRVGGNAGEIDRKVEGKAVQSHYFIKLNVEIPDFEEVYNRGVRFDHNNTVGPKSISKQELVKQLNFLYENNDF